MREQCQEPQPASGVVRVAPLRLQTLIALIACHLLPLVGGWLGALVDTRVKSGWGSAQKNTPTTLRCRGYFIATTRFRALRGPLAKRNHLRPALTPSQSDSEQKAPRLRLRGQGIQKQKHRQPPPARLSSQSAKRSPRARLYSNHGGKPRVD